MGGSEHRNRGHRARAVPQFGDPMAPHVNDVTLRTRDLHHSTGRDHVIADPFKRICNRYVLT